MVSLLSLSLLAVWICLACATGRPEPIPEPGTPSYKEAAEAAFDSAQTAYDRRDYTLAVERFERVRNRYPHSPYAALAELGISDALFAQDRFLEAADAYSTFVSLRPAHPQAHYAAWREALSLMRQAPSDLWILPPAHEKDLTHVREVIDVLERFMFEYPESEHVDEARELLDDALSRLARHELYVADFYKRRGQWRAVVFRLENVLDSYGGLGFDELAKTGLAEAYLKLDDPRPSDAVRILKEVLSGDDLDSDIEARAERLLSEAVHLAEEQSRQGED